MSHTQRRNLQLFCRQKTIQAKFLFGTISVWDFLFEFFVVLFALVFLLVCVPIYLFFLFPLYLLQ